MVGTSSSVIGTKIDYGDDNPICTGGSATLRLLFGSIAEFTKATR